MIFNILIYFLWFLDPTPNNLNEICKELCSDHKVDLEQEIIEPFNTYLSSLNISGDSEMEIYMNYLKYLSDNDDDHLVLDSSNEDYLILDSALRKRELIRNDHAYYEPLAKVLKKVKPTTSVIEDFKSVYKQLNKYHYSVSSGLIASGFEMALTDKNESIEPYRNLLILNIAPFAIIP